MQEGLKERKAREEEALKEGISSFFGALGGEG